MYSQILSPKCRYLVMILLSIHIKTSNSSMDSQDLAKLEPLLVDQAGGVEWTKVPNAEQPLDTAPGFTTPK